MRISQRLRRAVIERAGDRCEYCQSPQSLIVTTFEIDPILPLAAGGATEMDNLSWSCPTCNGYKAARVWGHDPLTGRRVRLFHPRRQRWERHFAWSEDGTQIIGRTACGRASIEALRMNHDRAVDTRRHWVAWRLHPRGKVR